MKQRLDALDGLRGFAAFSVMLSHTGFDITRIIQSPILDGIYRIFSAGPNSVQIFFVLAGFLMSFLYYKVDDTYGFLKKRYARIFPIFVVVNIYLIITFIHFNQQLPWSIEAGILASISLLFYFSWKFLVQKKQTHLFKYIFLFFLLLQAGIIIFNNTITPLITNKPGLPSIIKEIIIFISNVTLTVPFSENIIGLSGVFWSLTPEVLFYILFPVLIIPVITVTKRLPLFWQLLVIFSVTKLLFDLEHVFLSVLSLNSLNIVRSFGFVVGILVGTLYRDKDLWKKMEPLFGNRGISILLFASLLFLQWGDTYIRHGQVKNVMDWYYVISSVIIGFVIISCLIPKTICNKVFSQNILTFFGLISYSLYLTHLESINYAEKLVAGIFPNTEIIMNPLMNLLYYFLSIGFSIGVAFFTYYFVERIYFISKQTSQNGVRTQERWTFPFPSKLKYLPVIVLLIFFAFVFSTKAGVTQKISQHTINGIKPIYSQKQLSNGEKLRIPFTASESNLAIMKAFIEHNDHEIQGKKSVGFVHFRLLNTSGKVLVNAKQPANTVTGEPFFPFGFAPIPDSKGKQYVVEYSVSRLLPGEKILVTEGLNGLTGVYQFTKGDILSNPASFVTNKLVQLFIIPEFLFALFFIIVITLLYHFQSHKKLAFIFE